MGATTTRALAQRIYDDLVKGGGVRSSEQVVTMIDDSIIRHIRNEGGVLTNVIASSDFARTPTTIRARLDNLSSDGSFGFTNGQPTPNALIECSAKRAPNGKFHTVLRVPADSTVEICWRETTGTAAFWQLRNHPEFGSLGIIRQPVMQPGGFGAIDKDAIDQMLERATLNHGVAMDAFLARLSIALERVGCLVNFPPGMMIHEAAALLANAEWRLQERQTIAISLRKILHKLDPDGSTDRLWQ